MINDSELRLKLLEIAADKNPSEISDIISHAHKLYDFIYPGYEEVIETSLKPEPEPITSVLEELVKEDSIRSNTLTPEDAASIARIFTMCLEWCYNYKMSSIGDSTFLRQKILSYNMIPKGISESQISDYKKLIDIINNPDSFRGKKFTPSMKTLSDAVTTTRRGSVYKDSTQSPEDPLGKLYGEILNENIRTDQKETLTDIRVDKLNKVLGLIAESDNFDELYHNIVLLTHKEKAEASPKKPEDI